MEMNRSHLVKADDKKKREEKFSHFPQNVLTLYMKWLTTELIFVERSCLFPYFIKYNLSIFQKRKTNYFKIMGKADKYILPLFKKEGAHGI